MNLKCIGGPVDGMIYYVHDHCKAGDIVRILRPRELEVLSFIPLIDEIPALTVHQYSEYIITIIYMSKEDIKFLRPKDWTDEQAILHQFGK